MTTEEFKESLLSVVAFGNNPQRIPGVYNLNDIAVSVVKLGGKEIIKFDSFEGFNLAYVDPDVSGRMTYPVLCEKDGLWYGKQGPVEAVRDRIAKGCKGWRPADELLAPDPAVLGSDQLYHNCERKVKVLRALYILSVFRFCNPRSRFSRADI